LLSELESVVERGNIKWPTGAGVAILGRLGTIAQKVALAFSVDDQSKLH
jgi:hypothetical protein